MADLSIIIVNYNVRLYLEQCLDSVRKSAQGLDVEIIVVDNNSSDGSVDYLRQRFPEATFIENQVNTVLPRPTTRVSGWQRAGM